MIGMNKLPAKQIYLLMVIITGIIALSVYSTYAIFTFESETTDAFNIQLPSVLKIQTDISEYKQIEIPKNSYGTTDVDLYNTYDYELCYSIWYKVIGDASSLVDVYELNDTNLSTNGTIPAATNSRFTLLIVNNSDHDTKINVGLAAVKATDTCSLKLSSDKKNIKNIYDHEVISLKDHIIANVNQPHTDQEDGSLIYKNKTVDLSFNEQITIANKYTIKDNHYVLSNPEEIPVTDYPTKLTNLDYQTTDYFICRSDTCDTILKINDAKLSLLPNGTSYTYQVTNVDEYEVYQSGTSGIKKVNNNYYYYGDNPHNFVYYNCETTDVNSCELWRILGLIYDESTDSYKLKLIRNDSLGLYQYHSDDTSNTWKTSKLYDYLNDEYLVDSKFMSIYPHIFEEMSSLDISLSDITNTKITSKDKEISLINLTDYINASTCSKGLINTFTDCLNNNWLNRATISHEWTLTAYQELILDNLVNDSTPESLIPDSTQENQPSEEDTSLETEPTEENSTTAEETTEENIEIEETTEQVIESPPQVIKKQMYSVGNKITASIVTDKLAVRPVIYLQERILLYSGDGTIDNPYIIK